MRRVCLVQAGGVAIDLSRAALKICAVDVTWSGSKFARRRRA